MLTLTQVFIPLVLLASVVIGLPINEYEIIGNHSVNFSSYAFRNSENDRIYGGQEANIGQFPYQASLRSYRSHFCGGSIISNRFVVTAGHCYKRVSSALTVVVGAHMSNDGVAYGVNQFVVHEKYYVNINPKKATVINDIALIQTTTVIEFNNLIASIELHSKFFEDGSRAVTSGWGESNDSIFGLKFVHLNTLTNSDCRARLKRASNQIPPVHDFSTLCAFSGERGHGVCFGDSGGPLVSENQLIGITSWSIPCGKGSPDGFTRISTYVDWVNDKIRSL